MRLERVWKVVPRVGKKRNKRWEESRDSGVWQFHEEVVAGGPCASCRYLGGGGVTDHREGRGCRTGDEVEEDRETTDLSVMG